MSLFALPVTVSDLTTLQSGIQFFTNTAQANSEVPSINANQPNDSVFIYATKLLASNISLSQVAMAVSAILEGGTIAVGNTTTSNTLTFLSTQFLPDQVAAGLAGGFDPTVYAAQSLGLALASTAGFNANFAGLSLSQFVGAVATATGVNSTAIQQFVTNWTNFFTANPSAHVGLTVTQAAYGAAFGDAIGVALTNPTSANLQTVVSTTQGQTPVQFSPNTIAGLVANALIDVATGQYQTGVALGALAPHTPLQGEFNQLANGVFLTQGVDTPTSGFATDANGTPKVPPGFTATDANTVLNALPFVTPLGLGNNTLNTGDNLQTTGKATGATKLVDVTSNNTAAANPAFAAGVTMNGVNQLDITQASAGVGGFAGNVTGLLIENNLNSVGPVTLGGTGQGLKTLLTDINISGNGVPVTAANPVNTVVLAAAAADATKTINIGLTGVLGKTTLGDAADIAISNDVGGGTAANPNKTYGTWAITADSASNLELIQSVTTGAAGNVNSVGGVGGATGLNLSGKGNIAVGQAKIGDWQLLQTINAGGASGTVIVPGATAGNVTNAKGTGAAGANPFWLFGSVAGLLDNTGTGAFALKEYDLGSGTNVLDVSTATAAQIGALKTVANATPSTTNEIIVQNSVATTLSADTFKNIAGFQALGIGGPTAAQGAAGTINLSLLPASINTIEYFTKANGSVAITNQPVNTTGLTVRVNDETTAAQNLTVNTATASPTALGDSLTVIVGNANHKGIAALNNGGDALGDITAFGDELFTLNSVGGGAVAAGVGNGANDIGGTFLVPTPGGNEQVKITGDTTLQMAVTHSINGAISSSTGPLAASGFLLTNNLSVTITNTAATEWGQGLGGSLLFFQTDNGIHYPPVPAGTFAPLINYSNNAVLIDASASGGLISPWGDANFVLSPVNPALGLGDTIIGAANPVGYQTGGGASLVLGDVLVGSIGNDTITSKSMVLPDYIVTEGGADKITLAAGHTGADHVGFYAAAGNINIGGLYAVGSVGGAISEGGTGAFEFANPGWWGLATGAPSTRIDDGAGLFPGTSGGTSNSQSTLTNYNPTQDFLDFSVKAWSTAGLIGFGLTADNGVALVNAAPFASLTGLPVLAAQVAPGGTINTPGTTVDFIILSQGSFLNAAAVAGALHGGSYTITHAPLGATVEADFLLAYQGVDGNAHIANLHLAGAGAGVNTSQDLVTVSDMVNLAGVNLAQLSAANAISHIHLVS
jgi:hypothetical protein